MSQYVTIQGDMWDNIAISQCGSMSYVDKLIMANTEYIRTYIFPAGVKLEIPDFSDTVSPKAVLPPWKQVV